MNRKDRRVQKTKARAASAEARRKDLVEILSHRMMLAGALTIVASPAVLGIASSFAVGEFPAHIIYTRIGDVAMTFGFGALLTGFATSVIQKITSRTGHNGDQV